jgi:PAS domain S-box-containing protein
VSSLENAAKQGPKGEASAAAGPTRTTVQAPDQPQPFLSTLPAGPREQRFAVAVVAISCLIFAAAAPFAKRLLPAVPTFLPLYQAALIVCELLTAVLIFGQFRILRSRALLVLGSAYLFSALMAVAHALSFPGLFAPGGLLGAGPQTTAWIYFLWHGGFPLLVIAYAVLADREHGEVMAQDRVAVAVLVAAATALVAACGLTLITTVGQDLLPPIMQGNRDAPTKLYVATASWSLALVAIPVLWRRRPLTVLDLWLVVVMCVWVFDIALAAVLNAGRYDVGWYAGRVYGLLAGSSVLILLLLENGRLYADLAKARERENALALEQYKRALQEQARLEERVRERTAQLHESEERLRLLIGSVKDYAIFMLDPQGRVVTWNEGARRLKGHVEAEILGQPMERFFTPEDVAQGKPSRTREIAVLEGRAEDEGWRVRKDGTRFYANVSLSAMRDETGKLLGFANITRDVTERREAEQRIHSQLEHLNLLDHITRATGQRQDLESIFQVVVRSLEDILHVDFACVCLHDSGANALRVTCVGIKSESLSRELAMDNNAAIDIDRNGLSRCMQGELVHERDVGPLRFPFPERLARGGLRAVVMAPLRSESRVFGVLVAARRDADSFTSVECEFLRQLSEHVALAAHQAQLYGSLQQAYDELRQTQQAVMQHERLRALGQMASGIAHDINNALSPVSLYTESLLETEKDLSERARDYLETIQRAVEDVAHTVARMREFYRKRDGQLELTPVELNKLVPQVIDLTRARWSDMAQSRGVVVRVVPELAPDLPGIMGAESEIRDALTNLVFNAVDAMPDGGTLTLRTRLLDTEGRGAGSVAIEVVDTGVGMDEETRKRCLEPFFTTKGERGTGLGLAMVFGMVQRHSADLEIDSAPGVGTTVRLVFAAPTGALGEPDRPPAIRAPSRLRLLLVDDDPVLIKSLRDSLEIDGHQVVAANGGKEGIDEFRASVERGQAYAAVFTDLGMPYADGRKVAAAVKEASPGTPVIMLTGWGQRSAAEGEVPPHVDRVLAKPPKLREVREALAQLCVQREEPRT